MLAAWTSACFQFDPAAVGSVAARAAGGAFGPSMAVTDGGVGFPLTPALDAVGQGLLVYTRRVTGAPSTVEAVGYREAAPAVAPPSVTLRLPPAITPAADGVVRVPYACTSRCVTSEQALLHVGTSTMTVPARIVTRAHTAALTARRAPPHARNRSSGCASQAPNAPRSPRRA